MSDRPNMGPAAAQADDQGVVRDLVFRHSYILHGDLGADKIGTKAAHKTGDKPERYSSQGKSYD